MSDSNTWIDLLWIQDLICSEDEVALTKLPQIVDRLVKSAADRLLIRFALDQRQYTDAVRHLLTFWYSYGNNRADLLQELRRLNLNALADKIEDVQGEFGSEMQAMLFGDHNHGRKLSRPRTVSTGGPFTEPDDVTGLLKGKKVDDNLLRSLASLMGAWLKPGAHGRAYKSIQRFLDLQDFRVIQARSVRARTLVT